MLTKIKKGYKHDWMKDYFQIDLLKNGKIIVKMDMISY